jgi:uncharacterized protein involved in exopolysaccharide biosynthesis
MPGGAPGFDWLPYQVRPLGRSVWERRKPLIGFVAAVAVLAAGVSLLLPNWYSARSTILPPSETGDTFGIMSALIESSALSQLGLLSTSSPSDVYAEILKSRTLREELVVRFDLQRLYRRKNMDLTLKELDHHVKVDVNKAGLIVLDIEDRDPQRSAAMTNALVGGLDGFNRRTFSNKASRTREFLEHRLADVRERLAKAEATLTAYEKSHQIIASGDAAAVQGVADVIAQKLSLQVRRSYVSSYSRPDSPTLQAIEAELAAVDREIGRIPSLKQEGARLALDAEIQRRVFTLLTAQYEDARVQETRDTPTLAVLDVARAPQLKSKPKRSVMVLGATAMAAVLAVAWVAWTTRRTSGA